MHLSLFRLLPPYAHNSVTLNSIAVMTMISHAIEDVVLDNRLMADLQVGFQCFSHFMRQEERYRRLAEVCNSINIYGVADMTPPEIPGITFVPLSPESALADEWFVLVNMPGFYAALLAEQLLSDSVGSAARRCFNAVWTYDAEMVDQAVRALAYSFGQPLPHTMQRDQQRQQQHLMLLTRQFLRAHECVSARNASRQHRAALLRAGMNTGETAVLVVERDRHVLSVSPAAAELLGVAEPLLMGLDLDIITERPLAGLTRVLGSDSAHMLQLDDARQIAVTSRSVHNTANVLVGWVVVLHEQSQPVRAVTPDEPLEETIEQLQQHLGALQELGAMLTQFEGRREWERLLLAHVQRMTSELAGYAQRLARQPVFAA